MGTTKKSIPKNQATPKRQAKEPARARLDAGKARPRARTITASSVKPPSRSRPKPGKSHLEKESATVPGKSWSRAPVIEEVQNYERANSQQCAVKRFMPAALVAMVLGILAGLAFISSSKTEGSP